jgi:membrane fusion protein (multidrug efflux system)
LAGSVLTGCQKGADAGESSLSDAKKRDPIKVRVEPVVRRETVRHLETTTRVESEHHVELVPRAAGILTELLVEEGDPVQAGQVLARLDAREFRIALSDAEIALAEAQASLPTMKLAVSECDARLETAMTNAEQARRDHERNLAITRGGDDGPQLLSAKDLEASLLAYDQAQGEVTTARLAKERAVLEEKAGDNAVERARLALDRAELMLSYMEITAPIAGVIAERQGNVGDAVTTGAPAFVLTDPEHLRAVFFRPQRELRLFRGATGAGTGDAADGTSAGNRLEITAEADGLAGRTFEGWIERVSPTVDAASGNFRVTARLETGEPPDKLLPGMLVRLDIITERHPDSLVVPKRSIRREGDRSVLFVAADGLAHEIEVEEGLTDGDDVEVTPVGDAVLEEGAQVVVVGNRDLEQGAEVTIRKSETGAPDEPQAESESTEPAAEPAEGEDPPPAAEPAEASEE